MLTIGLEALVGSELSPYSEKVKADLDAAYQFPLFTLFG
jgi:hypothetical protein